MLATLLQALVSGLAVGGAYALVALGFSITFTTTRTLNFGHGEFVSVGAFVRTKVARERMSADGGRCVTPRRSISRCIEGSKSGSARDAVKYSRRSSTVRCPDPCDCTMCVSLSTR